MSAIESLEARNESGTIGKVVSVSGSRATVSLKSSGRGAYVNNRVTVGRFVGIIAGHSILVGVVTDVARQASSSPAGQVCEIAVHVDLFGEIEHALSPGARFRRGLTQYPAIDDDARLISGTELNTIFEIPDESAICLGKLQQDSAIDAYVSATDLVSKHFAVLGTTGVGKSSAIAIILQQILSSKPDLRIFVLDIHNEYGSCFGEKAHILRPSNLKLPFWLFNFDEIIDVFFGGRPGLEAEIDVLAEIIPLAKETYGRNRSATEGLNLRKVEQRTSRYTIDTPVPYRIADLLSLLDARMGKLENRASRMMYSKLITRIESVCLDPRFAFMFENANVGGDTMTKILGQLFRLPSNGSPMTVMQLAGFPAEALEALISVLCRLAFDLGLWSNGELPVLMICEEAHRFAAADQTVGFAPTRRSLARIAKEGRKYGVFLGLVTQRPAELDPTILSQCSTLFAMRMTNDRDQEILRSAIADTASNLLAFLPSLETGEALAFGEGVALPTRLKFQQLTGTKLPRGEFNTLSASAEIDDEFIVDMVERWRGGTMKEVANSTEVEATPARHGLGLDPDRFRLLKRAIPEHFGSEQTVSK